MTKMKEASKTGATGFGQLSEKELKVLKEASTALKKIMNPKDAQRYLDKMEFMLQRIVSGNSDNEFSQMSDEELRAIARGGQ